MEHQKNDACRMISRIDTVTPQNFGRFSVNFMVLLEIKQLVQLVVVDEQRSVLYSRGFLSEKMPLVVIQAYKDGYRYVKSREPYYGNVEFRCLKCYKIYFEWRRGK